MASGAQLSPAFQAVHVSVEIDGTPVKALIPREVFEERLKSGQSPEEWIEAYEQNAAMLEAVIRWRYAAKPQDFVVVRSSDFRGFAQEGQRLAADAVRSE
jgi:hypothetical protein